MTRRPILTLAYSLCFVTIQVVSLTNCGGTSLNPEQTVRRSIKAFNTKDLESLLSTIDPAKESFAREVIAHVGEETGISLQTLTNILPGLIQLVGNPLPDEWRLEEIQVKERKLDDDLAWVTISANLTTRIRDVKTKEAKSMRFALHNFDAVGWRIVDLQLP